MKGPPSPVGGRRSRTSQTTNYNGTTTTTGTAAEPQAGATLAGYGSLAGLAFARAFQEIFVENPTQAPWPGGLGFGVVDTGSAVGSHLAPRGSADNGLDPFYATVAQHAQTLTTPGPMAPGEYGDGEGGSSGGSGGSGGSTSSVDFGMGAILAAAAAQSGGSSGGSTNTNAVQHAPPEKAEQPHCECACGEEGGGGEQVHNSPLSGDPGGMIRVDIAARRDGVIVDLDPVYDRLDGLREQLTQQQRLADAYEALRQIESELLKDQVRQWAEQSYQARLLRESYDRALAAATAPESPTWNAVTSFWHSPFSQFGGAFVPGVGEAMDAEVLADPDAAGWVKTLAFASLVVSAATLTVAPNLGGLLRGADDALGVTDDAADAAKCLATLGYTTSRGVIHISDELGPSWRRFTENHERVHRFFTPGVGIPSNRMPRIIRWRQRAGIAGYERSAFLKYLEEALAEGYAIFRRTGSLQKAVGIGAKFPLRNEYVVLSQVLREVGFFGTGYGILLHGAYTLGGWFGDD